MISEIANRIFNEVITDYHKFDNIDQPVENPYDAESLEHLFLRKKLDRYRTMAHGRCSAQSKH